MNRSALISLLVLGAAGTGCALLIAATYVALHIPLPFSVILSCVVMTAAVAMIAFRVNGAKSQPTGTSGFGFFDGGPWRIILGSDRELFGAASVPRPGRARCR
jgi:hypothetical protein